MIGRMVRVIDISVINIDWLIVIVDENDSG